MTLGNLLPKFLFSLLFGSILFAFDPSWASSSNRWHTKNPMNFALVQSEGCPEICTQWISAEGDITADTPALFRKFLKSLGGKKLPVVFQSYGGSVDAALSIGRMIRKQGLETAVGRTLLKDCPMLEPRCQQKLVRDGWSIGEVRSGGAYCFSACPFMLAGGRVRVAASTASIGVHQLTTVRKTVTRAGGKKNTKEIISTEMTPAFRKYLSSYFTEMGISREIFADIALASPQGMYHVRQAEAIKLGLLTKVLSYDEEPGYTTCLPGGTTCDIAKIRDAKLIADNNRAKAARDRQKPAAFEDKRTNAWDIREAGEDTSCEMLNRIYMRARNHGRYSTSIYAADQNGQEVLIYEVRYIDRNTYTRQLNTEWKIWPRRVVSTVENGFPVFRHCLRLLDKVVNGVEVYHFSAAWSRGTRRDHAEAWISKATSLPIVVELGGFGFSSGKTAERFDFSRDVVPPIPPETMASLAPPAPVSVEIFSQPTVFAEFEDPRSHGIELQQVGEDMSCEAVRSAYTRTNNQGRHAIEMSELREDGREMPLRSVRFIDRAIYVKEFNDLWITHTRHVPERVHGGGGRFQYCIRLPEEIVEGTETVHFTSVWNDRPAEIWIAKETSSFARTLVYREKSERLLRRYVGRPDVAVPPSNETPLIFSAP